MSKRFDIELVILKIRYGLAPDGPVRYFIEADISNEGALDVHSCKVSVTGEGIESTL